MKAVVIKPGHGGEVVEGRWSISDIQREVDGWVESVAHEHSAIASVLVNEDGATRRLPVNEVGSALVYADTLVGTVVIVGTDDEGEWVDVPTEMVGQVEHWNEVLSSHPGK